MPISILAPLFALLAGSLAFVAAPSGARSTAPPRAGAVPRLAPPLAATGGNSTNGTAAFACTFAVLVGAALGASRRRNGTACKASLVFTSPDQAIPWWERQAQYVVETGIGLWAEKLNMTALFDEGITAKRIPATILVIKRGGNMVTGKKWPERHGMYSIQVGYERYEPADWELKNKWYAMTQMRLKARDLPPLRKLKEFRVRPHDWDKWSIGDKVWPSDIFEEGDIVHCHGRGKGKGFVSRLTKFGHMVMGPRTHGSKHKRRIGSLSDSNSSRVFPGRPMPGWKGRRKCYSKNVILKIIDKIDEDNMPESIVVVKGSVPGHTAHWAEGGSYVYLNKMANMSDGRWKRDPVWLWLAHRDPEWDQMKPIPGQAWTRKTMWGRQVNWVKGEVRKYWPDGYPGYDHTADPFYDFCDPRLAIKAPEW